MGLITPDFGRRTPIVVVDERTRRGAANAVAQALAEGDYSRAHAGLTAMRLWLRYEIRTGRKSKRVKRAALLEQVEMQLCGVAQIIGLAA